MSHCHQNGYVILAASLIYVFTGRVSLYVAGSLGKIGRVFRRPIVAP